MVFKTLLAIISGLFFFLPNIISGGSNPIIMSILKLFTLFISFLFLTIFFIKTPRFQKIPKERFIKKIIFILLLIGSIYFLTISYVLNKESLNYVVSPALDSISYFIQAKIFTTGHLSVPSHELKEFFNTGYCINDGKYYSKYFPGWPFLLSIGVALRVPWIINPLFSILTLLIIYLIGNEIYDRNTGLFAAILLMISFNYDVLTPGYMSEPSSLFFTSLFFYLMVKTLKGPKVLTSSLAGISLGLIFLIRPFSAIAVALPIMIYFFFLSIRDRKRNLFHFAIMILTFLPIFCIFFLYNYFQTGSMFVTPFHYYNPNDTVGFGLRSSDIFLDPIRYSFFDGLKNISINFALLNLNTFLFLFIFLILVIINKNDKWDYLLMTIVFLTIFMHLFYFMPSIRYYYPSFFALFLLGAHGLNLVEVSIKKIFPNIPIKNLNYFSLIFILVSNIFIISPQQKVIKRYEVFQELKDPFTMVSANNLRNSVVFVRSIPEPYFSNIGYYVQNPLDFKGEVLFVKDLKEKNIKLMEYYPQKEFYYYDFDTKTKSGKLTKINRK